MTKAFTSSLVEEAALEHIWFHATPNQSLKGAGGLIVFESGSGCYLTDAQGRTYLDGLSGGAFVTNIGHGRKKVADALADQAARLAYVVPYNFVAPPTYVRPARSRLRAGALAQLLSH